MGRYASSSCAHIVCLSIRPTGFPLIPGTILRDRKNHRSRKRPLDSLANWLDLQQISTATNPMLPSVKPYLCLFTFWSTRQLPLLGTDDTLGHLILLPAKSYPPGFMIAMRVSGVGHGFPLGVVGQEVVGRESETSPLQGYCNARRELS